MSARSVELTIIILGGRLEGVDAFQRRAARMGGPYDPPEDTYVNEAQKS